MCFSFTELDPEREPDPWDALEVSATSHDGERSYVFNAHRACLLAACHSDFREPEYDEIIARFGRPLS
jgi:hypothetical protein